MIGTSVMKELSSGVKCEVWIKGDSRFFHYFQIMVTSPLLNRVLNSHTFPERDNSKSSLINCYLLSHGLGWHFDWWNLRCVYYENIFLTCKLFHTVELQKLINRSQVWDGLRKSNPEGNQLSKVQMQFQHSIPNNTQHKKWSFPFRISSVIVTKSARNCGFGHIYWRNP